MGCVGPEWVRHAVCYQIFPDRFARFSGNETGCYNLESRFPVHSEPPFTHCDYFQIDPLLGGNEAFKELLAAAYGKGTQVILDGVFNHIGRDFCPFNNPIEHRPPLARVNWFRI